MWKIKVYETKAEYPKDSDPTKVDVLVHSMESSDKIVLAAFLRGVAESYDPPKPHLR